MPGPILRPARAVVLLLVGRRLASTKPSSSPRTTTTTTTAPANNDQPRTQTLRRIVLTGAVALVTVAGAVTGARLKTDRDVARQRQDVRETTVDERIAMLEDRRAGLMAMRGPLEKKLAGLRARMATAASNEQEKEGEKKNKA